MNKIPLLPLSLAFAALLGGCKKDEISVITQKYVHKYGYEVSKEEWDAKNYPGQVITTMRDGITTTATYEDGKLHGPYTTTFPHSQTIESYFLYNRGNLNKEIFYNIRGLPVKEVVHISPVQQTVTLWYEEGSPLRIEEYVNNILTEGQYYTKDNNLEARVVKGSGNRIERDTTGALLARETIEKGSVIMKEAFYTNGTPESICHYKNGNINGEKRTFSNTGEPLSIENWRNGKLDGTASYFKNGTKYMEITFDNGVKNGPEIHYIDGKTVSQKLIWQDNMKRGPCTYFIDGVAHTKWYYDNQVVSPKQFDDLCSLELAVNKQNSKSKSS